MVASTSRIVAQTLASITVLFCLVLLSGLAVEAHRSEAPKGHKGLSAQLTVESDTVPMGDPVEFLLHLNFNSAVTESTVNILNRSSWKCFVTFSSLADYLEYRRYPYDVGMPRLQHPSDLVYLRDDSLVTETLVVHLLSGDGHQIPPGKYSVRVTYENGAGGHIEANRESTGSFRQRPYAGPWKFWKCDISSEPL